MRASRTAVGQRTSRPPRPSRPPRVSAIASAALLPTMLRRPAEAMARIHERYGPVVRFGRGPLTFTFLFGAEANELLLAGNPGNFLWRPALALLIPVDGDTALVVSDGEDHHRRRRLVQPAFARKRIDGYLPIITEEVGAVVDAWVPGETVDVAAALRPAVRRIVVRSLFGDRLRDRADEIGDHLQIAIDYVNRSPMFRLDRPFPGNRPYARAMAARRRADEIVYAEIAARRAEPDQGNDVLAALLDAQDHAQDHARHERDDGGGGLTDEEVRDQVVSLIAAGYDTTSAGVAWTLHATFSHPEVRDRARAEVAAVAGNDPLTVEHLAAMPYLDGIVNETLRLWPPGPFSARQAVEDFEFAGHVVAGGSLVVYSSYVTHRLPALWPESERFDPERWVPGSPTYREPEPYSFVPFGGGYRRCIGFALATLEIKATLAEVLRRVDLQLLSATPAPTGIATMAPAGGVRAVVAARP